MVGSRSPWGVEVRDGVEPFETEWRALATPANATPFQAFGLMRLFFRTVVANGHGTPVVALVRHADGRPAALFPMLRTRRYGLVWLRTDARPLDFCAPILDPALTAADVPTIARTVLAAVPGADLLYCNKMPARFFETASVMPDVANAARLRLSAWSLRLAGRSVADLAALQPTRSRGHLRRSRQKLERAYAVAFSIAFGDAITDADFETFRRLRSESAAAKGRSNILDDPFWTDFYLGLRNGEADPCVPWLAKLTADGEVIAVLFGFQVGTWVMVIMPASKLGDWKTYAPGLQLMQDTILHFHAAGAELFDLSIGDMSYKRRFGCDEVALHDALFAWRPLGLTYYVAWRAKIRIRNRMKKIGEN
jgi:CelD/BcsL family acetyltransferase involved in cellulose biosynthesis